MVWLVEKKTFYHFLDLNFAILQKSIENKVAGEIHKYLKEESQ